MNKSLISILALATIFLQYDAKSINQDFKRSVQISNKLGNEYGAYGYGNDDEIIIQDSGRRSKSNDNMLLFLLPLLFGNQNRGLGGSSSGLFGGSSDNNSLLYLLPLLLGNRSGSSGLFGR